LPVWITVAPDHATVIHTGKAAPSSARAICEPSAAKTLDKRPVGYRQRLSLLGLCFGLGALHGNFVPFSSALQHGCNIENLGANRLSMLAQ